MEVDAIGPDLRWQVATVAKAARNSARLAMAVFDEELVRNYRASSTAVGPRGPSSNTANLRDRIQEAKQPATSWSASTGCATGNLPARSTSAPR